MAIGDQSQQVAGAGLDLSQISNVVNMSKISDKRKRNEMMRLGTSDPNAFALQNQPQLQQAQQPSEFWGAGRKLGEDQTPDLTAAAGVGPVAKLGGEYYYYGDTDATKAQYGTQGYTTKDLGGGQYDILGSTGQSLGKGYKSLADSIYELSQKNLAAPTQGQFWKDIQTLPDNFYKNSIDPVYQQTTRSLDEQAMAAAGYRANPNYRPAVMDENGWMAQQAAQGTPYQQSINGYQFGGGNYETLDAANAAREAASRQYIRGNEAQNWETLGQLLNYGGVNGEWGSLGSIGGNAIADPIKGLNTLYGSNPLLVGDKLYGYKVDTDVDPLQKSWNEVYSGKYSRSGDMGQSAIWREYNNPNWWLNPSNAKSLGDGSVFLSPEKALENPGWLNKDELVRNVWHQDTGGSGKVGILGKVFNVLDPILDKVNPTHNMEQETVRKIGGFDTQQQAFSTVMPMILNYFFPGVGGLITGVDSASRGDSAGIGRGLLNSAISYGGTQLGGADASAPTTSEAYIDAGGMGGTAAGSNLSGTSGLFGSSVDLGSNFANTIAQNAIISAGQGGLSAAIGGKNAADSLLAALSAGAGGATGTMVGNLTRGYGPAMSGFLSGASSGAVSSLAQPEKMLESALTSGVGRGLGGLFTQMQDNPTQAQRKSNLQLGQNTANLAKLFIKGKNGTTNTNR